MTFKFSIVTPAYNSEKYIRETIESVIKQKGDFCIEYFVLDNNSTDHTCHIVREYQKLLTAGKFKIFCSDVKLHLISQHDKGMYDAIKMGFERAHGELFAWINSDDIYLPGAFDIIQRTFERYPKIMWLKGITSYMNKNSTICSTGHCNLYRQDWIKAGLYGTVLYFIQQDSVFWRADLWHNSGGVDNELGYAGDFFLWKSFAEISPLYSLNAYVSCFRKTPNQKSTNIQEYFKEIFTKMTLDKKLSIKIKLYFNHLDSLPRILRPLFYRLLFGRHQHYLLTLSNFTDPCLSEGDYYDLKDKI